MNEKGLGERLQKARRDAGLTQQQLCDKAGLSYSTLAKIERGAIKAPSIFTIQSIANVLQTPLDVLVGAGGNKQALGAKKRSKSGLRFVYFDVNGCLVRFFHRAFTKLAEDTNVSADIIETAFWHDNDAVCRGEMPLAEFNRHLAKKLGLPSLDWQAYYAAAVEPIPEMRELVKWAVEHYQVGLLTNMMPGFLDVLRREGLVPDAAYAAVIDSSEVHAIKPEAKIFELAQAQTHCQPEEVLFVDDSRPNLMAAEKFGWRVLWFDDYSPEDSVARVRDALEPEA